MFKSIFQKGKKNRFFVPKNHNRGKKWGKVSFLKPQTNLYFFFLVMKGYEL